MEAKEITGIELEGVKVINSFNGESVPVFVADYVLGGYGTGAVMAVPAHDERDFEFAKKYDLGIKKVISPEKGEAEECFVDDGILVNSENYADLSSSDARDKMAAWLEEKGLGKKVVNYRLRDWSISRQRYWGCPIPIVYSPEGEAHLVPEEHLPWTLPEDVDFHPTGVSPLAKSQELKKRVEDIFGKGWVAEYDTMDTFVDSAWYFLRYPDAHNSESFCSQERMRWLPVDAYIGGAEHTYMHLLFARFFVKALHKIGHLNFDEPFLKLRHQGMVLDKEGKKMSKSKGNVINPDDMVERFGADSVRTYMLFVAPLEDAVMWNEDNIVGVYRFLGKIWKIFEEKELMECGQGKCADIPKEIPPLFHKTVKKVTEDIESFNFNTAISAMMIFVNEISKHEKLPKSAMERFLVILSPFAPHIAEELWARLGHAESIFLSEWPKFNPEMIKDKEVNIVVQVNGKVRDTLRLSADISEEEAKKAATESEKVKGWIENREIKKIIYIKNKLVSIVV